LDPLKQFAGVKSKVNAVILGMQGGGAVFILIGCLIMYLTSKFRKEKIKYSPNDQKEDGVLTSFLSDYKNGKTKDPIVKTNGIHKTGSLEQNHNQGEELPLNNNEAIGRNN
jgi:hypothetical protein